MVASPGGKLFIHEGAQAVAGSPPASIWWMQVLKGEGGCPLVAPKVSFEYGWV